MPEPTPQKPKAETVTVEEMLRRNGVDPKNLAAAETPVAPQKEAAPKNGAAFLKDGRWFYRYDLDGETLILPKPIEQMTEQEFYDLPITLMDNGTSRLPQNLTVKFKDPQWAGYWFNKKANSAARVGWARSLGFVPALCSELEWYPAHLTDSDGALEQGGDLVLMKIHKAKLYAYNKRWMDKARRDGGVMGYKNEANRVWARDKQGNDPYYVAAQAMQEYQGVGVVAPVGEGGKLIIPNG